MTRNKIEELKRVRFSNEYENMLASPTVKEINPDCKGVIIAAVVKPAKRR